MNSTGPPSPEKATPRLGSEALRRIDVVIEFVVPNHPFDKADVCQAAQRVGRRPVGEPRSAPRLHVPRPGKGGVSPCH
jgi:hypothetical protein